jgi:translation elongation factor EF-Tu-like GTPase
MDAFLDINISCDNVVEAEDLENIIEDNADLIADWDFEGDEQPIISLQFLSFDNLSEFVKVLKENGYEI